MNKIKNIFKKAGLVLLGTLIPYMPMANAQEKPVVNKTAISTEYGHKNETLMGRDFAKGHVVEVKAKSRKELSYKGGLKLDGLLRVEDLNYVDGKGTRKNQFMDMTLSLEQFADFETYTTKAGFGINVDMNKAEQEYDGINVGSMNITAGPAITGNVDSDYVGFDVLIGSGFGKAGNDVQGNGLGIKAKLRLGLDFDLTTLNIPLQWENYGDLEVTFLETENTTRNEYEAELGTRINYEIIDNLFLTLGYSHSWHLGNDDNTVGSTVKGGLKVNFNTF